MPLSPIQLNEVKRKLREQGMSDDKIDITVRKVQEQYEEKYGTQTLDAGGYSPNASVSPTSQPRPIQQKATPNSTPRPQINASQAQPEGEENLVSNFFKSLYNTGQDPRMVEQQQNLTGWKKVAQGVADAAPLVAGTVTGLAGAALGAAAGGVGAIPGGAIGTGVGVAAGKAFENALENLIGTQDQTPIDQVKEQVVEASTAAAFDFVAGKALSAASPLVSSAFRKVGQVVGGAGDNLALRAIRPNPSQQRMFFQKTGLELKEFVVNNGLFQEGVEQVDQLITPLQQSFDEIATSQNIKVPVKIIKQKFDDAIKMLGDQPTEQAQNLASKINANLDLFMKKVGNKRTVPAAVITEIRRNIDKVIPASQWLKDPLEAAVNTQTRRVYQAALQEAAGDITVNGKNLLELGQELSNLYAFREIAASQQYLGKGTLPVGIIKSLMFTGGFGAGATFGPGEGFGGNLRDGLIVGTGSTLINNPKVISFLSKQLMKNGQMLANLPDKELAKVGTEIVRRSLSNVLALMINDLGKPGEVYDQAYSQNPNSVFRGNDQQEKNKQNSQGIFDNSQNQVSGSVVTQPENFSGQQTNSSQRENSNMYGNSSVDQEFQNNPPITDSLPQADSQQPQIPVPFNGMSKYELVQLAVARGFSGAQLDEIRNTYDTIMADYQEAIGGQLNSELASSLFTLREQAVKAGRDTSIIDAQLQKLGFNASEGQAGRSTADMTEKERMFNNAAMAAEDALALLESGDAKSGFGQGLLGGIGEKTGANSDEQQQYRASIALARTTARNALLGANMTEKELESIQAFIPEYNDAPNVAKEKLETFINLMKQFSGQQPNN